MNYKKLVAPSNLLFLGLGQALIPYIYWELYGLNESYSYDVSYGPLLIIIVGFLFFWLGSRPNSFWFGSRTYSFKSSEVGFLIATKRLRLITYITLVAIIIQLLYAIKLYGGIPMLMYITSEFNVQDLNTAQTQSGFGQLGFLLLTTFFLNGLILSHMISGLKKSSNFFSITLILLLFEIFLAAFMGKRQGIMIALTFYCVGLCIVFGSPIAFLLNSLKIKSYKNREALTVLIIIFFIIFIFGIIGSLRNNETSFAFSDALREVIRYYELPLINLENLYEITGLGWYDLNFMTLFIGIVPYKILVDLDVFSNQLIPTEPTAGFGFFGGIIISFGIFGVIIMSFAYGKIAAFFYARANRSLFFLLVYCQMAWTLIASHSYNFMLSAHFLWAPAVLFFLLSKFIANSKVIKNT